MTTLDDLIQLLKSTDIPIFYHHYKSVNGENAPIPFITYVLPSTNNFMADNAVYQEIQDVDIEVYTKSRDKETQNKIKKVLTDNEIPYNVTTLYIEKEKVFQTVYEVTI